jgi:hypothetical protein
METDQKNLNWLYGFISVASLALIKFFYNLTVENAAKKVELQIIAKQNELEARLSVKFNAIEDKLEKLTIALESQKRHNNKNSENEILLLKELMIQYKKNDKHN